MFHCSALLTVFAFSVCAIAEGVEAPDILAELRPEHPRLIITADVWEKFRKERSADHTLDALLSNTEERARSYLDAPDLVRELRGRRMLHVSREAVKRIQHCAFAYRVTGEKVFFERTRKDMLDAAAFKDWNPSHFLDTAEMTGALAIGYDWLFDELSVETRKTLRNAIVEKGIRKGLTGRHTWFQRATNNWNQVCFGGLALGALAIAEDVPDLARELLTLARSNNPLAMAAFAPKGVYPEGPGYWNYGTHYQVMMISALESALGTDWDISQSPGFLESAEALVAQIGPTGMPFNFSDTREQSMKFAPLLYWFAQRTENPGLVHFQRDEFRRQLDEENELPVFLPLWFRGLARDVGPNSLPLSWHGEGKNPIGIFRSSWTDPEAVFLAFKGGSAAIDHGHMDAGSFVLEANGVRWARDLGLQSYETIESKGWNLFHMAQQSDRWKIYRLNNFSHNTLTLGKRLHRMDGVATIISIEENMALLDLTAVFGDVARNVTRKFSMKDGEIHIRDEIRDAEPGLSVRWQMLTSADVEVDGGGALLSQKGKTLEAEITSLPGLQFTTMEAVAPDDGVNEPVKDTRILAIDTTVPDDGTLVIEVRFRP